MAASEILFNFPTVSDAGQALGVCWSKVKDIKSNLPTIGKGAWVVGGYWLSLGVGVGASSADGINTEEAAVAALREEISAASGVSGEDPVLDLSTADLSKINWGKVLAALQAIIALFSASNGN